MKKTFLLGAILFFASWSIAQQKTYNGSVSDESGKPLTGATVAVKNTKTKALTSNTGSFLINAEKGATLQISFSGYETMGVLLSDESTLSIFSKLG